MDSQPCFVTNVAEQFDCTGDIEWVRRHKSSCEKALDYLLARDWAQADGLRAELRHRHRQTGRDPPLLGIAALHGLTAHAGIGLRSGGPCGRQGGRGVSFSIHRFVSTMRQAGRTVRQMRYADGRIGRK